MLCHGPLLDHGKQRHFTSRPFCCESMILAFFFAWSFFFTFLPCRVFSTRKSAEWHSQKSGRDAFVGTRSLWIVNGLGLTASSLLDLFFLSAAPCRLKLAPAWLPPACEQRLEFFFPRLPSPKMQQYQPRLLLSEGQLLGPFSWLSFTPCVYPFCRYSLARAAMGHGSLG